jgi:hypothetical protein
MKGGYMKEGVKKLKRQIKNITKQYKRMKKGSRKLKSVKRKLRNRITSRRFSKSYAYWKKSRSRNNHRNQRGGYAQYQNNMPMTPTYQVAGVDLPASQLALANPPPIKALSNCVNCVDNFSRFPPPGQGFPSKGN